MSTSIVQLGDGSAQVEFCVVVVVYVKVEYSAYNLPGSTIAFELSEKQAYVTNWLVDVGSNSPCA